MIYIKVRWIHDFSNDPIMLYSELDDYRMEIRKVEVFADGTCGYASQAKKSRETRLGKEPIPPLSEIGKDPQFEPEEISKENFEGIWNSNNPNNPE